MLHMSAVGDFPCPISGPAFAAGDRGFMDVVFEHTRNVVRATRYMLDGPVSAAAFCCFNECCIFRYVR